MEKLKNEWKTDYCKYLVIKLNNKKERKSERLLIRNCEILISSYFIFARD